MLPQSWLLNIVSVLFNIPIMWAESFLGYFKMSCNRSKSVGQNAIIILGHWVESFSLLIKSSWPHRFFFLNLTHILRFCRCVNKALSIFNEAWNRMLVLANFPGGTLWRQTRPIECHVWALKVKGPKARPG